MLVLEHVSPATRLLEKRRQMFEVQEALEHQKLGFSRKEEIFRRQEESLKKKDLDLQESLIKFSKFLQVSEVQGFRVWCCRGGVAARTRRAQHEVGTAPTAGPATQSGEQVAALIATATRRTTQCARWPAHPRPQPLHPLHLSL